MRVHLVVALALFPGLLVGGHRLRSDAAKAVARAPPKQDTQHMLSKLEHVSLGLEKMLATGAGPLEKMKPVMTAFATELKRVVSEVKTDKSLSEAQKLAKLEGAQQSMDQLTQDLSKQQARLQKTGEEEKESLLMGVLMTRQNEPLAAQLAILDADEFKSLPVAQALRKSHTEEPLFKQVAVVLDGAKFTAPAASPGKDVAKAEKKAQAKTDLAALTALLTKNLARMEGHLKEEEALHKKRVAELDKTMHVKLAANRTAADRKKLADLQRQLGLMKKQADRAYVKQHAMQARDVHALKEGLEGIKRGDAKALEKAKAVLTESMQAMQAQVGDFLHLLQTGAYTARQQMHLRDCPYCAAQCLEKCHADGQSYVQCMSVTCKDAGKR